MKNELNKLLEQLLRKSHPKHIDLSLSRVRILMEKLGSPDRSLPPVVHVAGTNGKGSVIAFLRAMLEAAGYRVHVYTSPYLVRFNERIVLAGEEIKDEFLVQVLQKAMAEMDSCQATYFETITAAAFLAFSETPADILLLETGMGGRLDATNVVEKPLLTAITPISCDHQEFLGETLTEIALEKAGILKSAVPCISGRQPAEAEEALTGEAGRKNVPIYCEGRDWFCEEQGGRYYYLSGKTLFRLPEPSLAGLHQYQNAAMAVACIRHLKGLQVTEEAMQQGIGAAFWPARCQKLTIHGIPEETECYLDGGHNPSAGEVIASFLSSLPRKETYLVCGMMQNKDIDGFLAPFKSIIQAVVFVPVPGAPREAGSPEWLSEKAGKTGMSAFTAGNWTEAIKNILNQTDDNVRIMICGSLYLAGDVLSALENSRNDLVSMKA